MNLFTLKPPTILLKAGGLPLSPLHIHTFSVFFLNKWFFIQKVVVPLYLSQKVSTFFVASRKKRIKFCQAMYLCACIIN